MPTKGAAVRQDRRSCGNPRFWVSVDTPPAIPILAQSAETLVAARAVRGVTCSLREARQVLSCVISDGSPDPIPRVSPRKVLLNALREHADWSRPGVVERVADGEAKSVRYLFRLRDGLLVEAVRIGLLRADCFTVCLSSQVGCAMACDFCATGRLGLARNLTPE